MCSGKDVSIKLLEEELSKVKTGVSKKDAQIASLGELQTSTKQDVLQYMMISERSISYLQWFLKEGIPSFVCSLLNSCDFHNINVGLQTALIQLRLHQACVEMKEKYPDVLDGKNVIYSYPDAQCRILDRFSDMVSYK